MGIEEIYELTKKLQTILFDKAERESYFDKIISSGIDLKTDFIRDIYQEEAAQRKQLKQDYTPNCLCNLFYELAQEPVEILDECAGTGSLAIAYIANGIKKVTCIEKSKTVFPILLFNMAIRNVTGYVILGDITDRKITEVHKLEEGDKYSEITKTKEVPEYEYKTIISNPPYSMAWSGIPDERFFGYEIPPKSKADYLFVLDIISRIKDDGEAFVLLPHGVLFRGNQEGEIRKKLVWEGYIHGIIGLPDNMFLNTSIPTVMMCISKRKQDGIYVMDATKYAIKGKKTNTLPEDAIIEIAQNYKKKNQIEKVARLVPLQEIERNGYNLNIPRYIDTFEKEEIPDIREIVSDILQTDAQIRDTERKLAGMMKEIVGENYQTDIAEVLKLWS